MGVFHVFSIAQIMQSIIYADNSDLTLMKAFHTLSITNWQGTKSFTTKKLSDSILCSSMPS